MKKKSRKKLVIGSFIAIFCCVISISFFHDVDSQIYHTNKTNVSSNTQLATYDSQSSEYLHLSDIPYLSGQTAWGNIVYDKTSSNQEITMKVEGSNVSFKKGIWAHATSTLIYDIGNYNYDYFTSYMGLNTTAATSSNGVKFSIYTSQDSIVWTLIDASLPEVIKPGDNAAFVKINIQGVRYLKLVANDNGNNGNDHSVYGDAKLIKEGYTDNVTTTVEEYDKLIKAANDSQSEDLELLLLQRELVSKFGTYQLKTLFEEGEEFQNTFNSLLNDKEMLRLYIMGGKPDGTYAQSIKVLTDLYQNYQEDLTASGTTSNGTKLSDVYKKMMISLSLSHSQTVGFWISSVQGDAEDTSNPNISIARNRYKIYKQLFLNDRLTSFFDTLEVEDMRYIMASTINDDEIIWLRDYAESKGNSISAYSYMNYINVNTSLYRSEKYYADDISSYQEQYRLSGYDVINKKYFPRLWMIMDTGGVCWQLSNLGQNVTSSLGYPSTIIGQPGHTAYLVYKKDSNNNGIWEIWNNVGGWPLANTAGYSGTKGYHTIRLVNQWGNGSYASSNQVSYILLGQAAINDYENYRKAKEKVMLAEVYTNDKEKQEKYYREALNIQSFNLDAWLGIINLYIQDSSRTDAELYQLASDVATNLKYYPLPMYDMLRLINAKITDPAYMAAMTMLQTRTLQEATTATNDQVLQSDVVRTMANYLLGIIDTKVADFSFDGEDGGKIKLGSQYETTNTTWNYSLDGGNTWTLVDSKQSVQLSEEEIAKINATNDIKVHIMGVDYSTENVYTIDITEGDAITNLYGNDLENKVIGATDDMEWKMAGSNTWTLYSQEHPDLTGVKSVEVRNAATGTKLAGPASTFTFTEDVIDEQYKYIPIDDLSIYQFSSETVRPNMNQYEYAKNAIDGNLYTHWHSSRVVTNDERYIVIELAEELYISRLQYVPVPNYNYGMIKNAIISTSLDGENFEEVQTVTDLPRDYEAKNIDLPPTKARYIKLQVTASYDYMVKPNIDYFASIAMLNLFEDSTKMDNPTANLEYSTKDMTNQDVIVRLVNPSTEIEITNNNGSNEHTFTENGSFTFEFKDADDRVGSITAIVDWIDKKKPSAEVTYQDDKFEIAGVITSGVLATITFDEDVVILNQDLDLIQDEEDSKKYYYRFLDNAGFCLNFKDMAGNENTQEIVVNTIDKEYPTATFTYNPTSNTTDSVTATLVPSEPVTVINNNGNTTYTFTQNGSFTFEFEDQAGNYGSATATVTWIQKDNVDVKIEYSTTNPTTKPVVATLKGDNIQVINNNKSTTYTFTTNGSFTFEYINSAGEVKTIVAEVNWIENEKASTTVPVITIPIIEYNKNELSNSTNSANSTKIEQENNTDQNSNDNQSNDNSVIETTKYRNYSNGNVSVRIPANLLSDGKLVYKKLTLTKKLSDKFGRASEYFEVYLVDNNEQKINIKHNMTMTIKLDKEKKFLGLYVLDGNKFKKVDYKKIADDKISVKVKSLGKYLISYSEKDLDNSKTEINNKNLMIIIPIGIMILLIISFIFLKKRKSL